MSHRPEAREQFNTVDDPGDLLPSLASPLFPIYILWDWSEHHPLLSPL